MASAIKKFFEKKKMDVKFKKAGSGHALTDDTRSKGASSSSGSVSRPTSSAPSQSQKMAAQAALMRNQTASTRDFAISASGPQLGTSAASVKMQAKKEMEAAKKQAAQAERDAPPRELQLEGAPVLAVEGVFFRCELSGSKALPKKEMEDFIDNFLLEQLAEEPMMTSALMIHTLNKDPDKSKICMETLTKYIDNIVDHPGEEKYRKIRVNNKAFQERVAKMKGTQEFLQAAGFQPQMMEGPNGEEEFLVMDSDHAQNTEHLTTLKDILLCAEPIKPVLDRNVKVYYPSQYAQRMELPAEFFSMTADELKKEQQLKQDATEKLGMLRTKEMRERERLRELRRYRYCLIRVRLPDGIILQGTFRAHDKFPAVVEFVQQSLEMDWVPFHLASSTGHKLTEETQSLAELGLAPATVINFQYDQDILNEMAAQQGSTQIQRYLKEELLANIQSL